MEALVVRLVDRRKFRTAILLVERWSEIGEPSPDARLAEARAFLDLRMVDRAWLRVRDLVESAEPRLDAMAVAVELFLLRGWASQARKLIQRALEILPGDPVFVSLEGRAQDPPTVLEDDPGENAAVADLVRMAENNMVRGAFLRARTLLERARRREPHHPRVADLLWALAGDYGTTESIQSMVQRLATELGPLDEPDEDEEENEEPEHTENVRAEELRAAEAEPAFPQLFRRLDPDIDITGESPVDLAPVEDPDEDFTGSEVTAITALSEIGADATFGERTDHGEDTQIARVMGKAGPVIHRPAEAVDAGFNLKDFRRDMGMAHVEDLEVGGEDEDDDLVIHTRQLDHDGNEGTREDLASLGSDAGYERLAKSRVRGAADESWARPSTTPGGAPAPPPELRAAAFQEGPSGRPNFEPGRSSAREGRPLPARPPRNLVTASTVIDAWPYWVAAMSAMLALFVLVFAVLSVVAAITPMLTP